MMGQEAHMIQQLDSHLDIRRLASDHDQSLPFSPRRCRRTIHAHSNSARFHDLDLARTHVPDLVDLASTFANYTAYQVVRDVDLLCLELLRGIVVRRGWWGTTLAIRV